MTGKILPIKLKWYFLLFCSIYLFTFFFILNEIPWMKFGLHIQSALFYSNVFSSTYRNEIKCLAQIYGKKSKLYYTFAPKVLFIYGIWNENSKIQWWKIYFLGNSNLDIQKLPKWMTGFYTNLVDFCSKNRSFNLHNTVRVP